jgi:hypothetical protein
MMHLWAQLAVLCLCFLHAEAFSWPARSQLQPLAADRKHERQALCTAASTTTMAALPEGKQHDRRSWLQSAAVLLPLSVLLDTQIAFAEAASVGDVNIAMRGKDVKVKDVLGKKASLIVSNLLSSIDQLLCEQTLQCSFNHSAVLTA